MKFLNGTFETEIKLVVFAVEFDITVKDSLKNASFKQFFCNSTGVNFTCLQFCIFEHCEI